MFFCICALVTIIKDQSILGLVLSMVLVIQSFLSYQGDINSYLLNKIDYKWEIADRIFCLVTLFTTLTYFIVKKRKITLKLTAPLLVAVIFWILGMREIRKPDTNETLWAISHTIWHICLAIFLIELVLQKTE